MSWVSTCFDVDHFTTGPNQAAVRWTETETEISGDLDHEPAHGQDLHQETLTMSQLMVKTFIMRP